MQTKSGLGDNSSSEGISLIVKTITLCCYKQQPVPHKLYNEERSGDLKSRVLHNSRFLSPRSLQPVLGPPHLKMR